MNDHRKLFSAYLFFVFICGFTSIAVAQRSEITFYVGGFHGEDFVSTPSVLFPKVEAVFNDRFTGGIRYAYFFNNRIAGEVGAGFTPARILAQASFAGGPTSASSIIDIDTWVMHANLTVHLIPARVIPYATAGVGAVHFSFQTSSFGFLTPSETDFAWNAGGGLKIPVRHDTALRFDSRVYWMKPEFAQDKTNRFIEITGGVSILFDF